MKQINNLPEKELKVTVIRTLTELWKRIDEFSGNFNKQPENIKKEPVRAVEHNNSNERYMRRN